MNSQTILDKLNSDTIANEELILGLNADNHHIIGLTFFKIIERKYCDEQIRLKLAQLGSLLKDRPFYGPYKYSHIAISTLYLSENDDAIAKYQEILIDMSEDDKYFVDNFIRGMKDGSNLPNGEKYFSTVELIPKVVV